MNKGDALLNADRSCLGLRALFWFDRTTIPVTAFACLSPLRGDFSQGRNKFERYTKTARRTIFHAGDVPSPVGSPGIATVHLLFGVLGTDNTLARRFLGSPSAPETLWNRPNNANPFVTKSQAREKSHSIRRLNAGFGVRRSGPAVEQRTAHLLVVRATLIRDAKPPSGLRASRDEPAQKWPPMLSFRARPKLG